MDRTTAANARAGLYRLLADTYLYPDAELARAVQSGEFQKDLAVCAAHLPELPEEDLDLRDRSVAALATLTERRAQWDAQRLEAEYVETFGHIASRECPPYETEYSGSHIFQQSQELADIAGFYRAFGLAVGTEVRERVDHISAELQFLGELCRREAYARIHHRPEQREACESTQRKFFADHLGRWGQFFAQLVQQRDAQNFYGLTAVLLDWFLAYEALYLDVGPEWVTAVRPAEEPDVMGDLPNAEWVGEFQR